MPRSIPGSVIALLSLFYGVSWIILVALPGLQRNYSSISNLEAIRKAPTGRDIPAQGNALGLIHNSCSPATLCGRKASLSANNQPFRIFRPLPRCHCASLRCRLRRPVSLRSAAWQVKKLAHGKASGELIHPPDKPAGAFSVFSLLAAKLAHLPGKLCLLYTKVIVHLPL